MSCEFLRVMDKVIEWSVLEEVRGCDKYSIMVDKSTDIHILKQPACYCRDLVDGKLETCFLIITDLSNCKANTITLWHSLNIYQQVDLQCSVDCKAFFGSKGA